MAVEVGTAFVTIVPSAKGFARRLQQEIGDEFVKGTQKPTDDAGDKSSKSFAQKFTSGLKSVLPTLLKGALSAPLIAAAAGSVVQAMALIGPAVAAAGGALALLPAIGVAAVAGLSTLKIAFSGLGGVLGEALSGDVSKAKEQLAELPPAAREVGQAFISARPAIDAFRASVANATLAGLGAQLTVIGRTLLPVISGQLTQIGVLFNTAFKETAAVVQSSSFFLGLNQALINTRAAIGNLTPALAPLVSALASVAVVGSSFLPQLTAGLGGAVIALANFVTAAAQTGQLQTFIGSALQVLGQLFAVLQQVGGIVVAVFSAAGQAVGGFASPLLEVLKNVNAFLSAGEGQAALVAVFTALSQAAAALRPVLTTVLSALGQGLAALAPAFAPLIAAAGQVVTALAPILPIIGQLAGALASALTPIISALAPAIAGLVQGLSAIFVPLLPIITQLGQIIGALIVPLATQLAASFATIGAVIGPIIGALGAALQPILVALAPLFAQLMTALSPLLGVLVVLAPPLVQLVTAFTPLISIIASLLGIVIAIVAPIIQVAAALAAFLVSKAIAPLLGLIASALGAVLGWLQPVAEWLQKVGEFISNIDWGGVGTAIKDGFGAALSWLGSFFANLWTTIVGGLSAALDGVVNFFTALPGRIGSALAALPALIGDLSQRAFNGLLFAVGFAIGFVIKQFIELPGRIGAAVSALWTFVVNQFQLGVQRAILFFTVLVPALVAKALELRTALIEKIGSMISSIIGFFQSLPPRISDLVSRTWSQAKAMFSQGVDNIIAIAKSLPGRAADAVAALKDLIVGRVQNAIGAFKEIGSQIIDGLIDGIKGAVGRAIAAVKNAMGNIVDGAKSALGINSPSRVFAELGAGTIEGYVLGIDRNAHDAEQAVLSALQPPSVAAIGAAAAGAVLPSATLPGPTFIEVKIGERPLHDIVETVITDRPQVMSEAVEIGDLQRGRR